MFKTRKLVFPVVSTLIIFASWLMVVYLGGGSAQLPAPRIFVVPLLWSLLFIYLDAKNYLYIAINAYALFLLMLFADVLNFREAYSKIQFAYLSVSMFVAFFFVSVYQDFLIRRYKVISTFCFCIAISLSVIPVCYIAYVVTFDAYITQDVFCAISQTNLDESLEFLNDYISPLWLVCLLIIILFNGALLLMQEKYKTLKIERSLLALILIIFACFIYFGKSDFRLYTFAKNAMDDYKKELELFRETQKKRKIGDIKFEAKKTEAGETYIVAIGESLNKRHMGVYGYMRNTTPLLSKMRQGENLLIFDNTYSNHTHTMPVLSLSLTEANTYNNKVYYTSLSIINVFNQAGFETHWITNQPLYGLWDNLVSIIAHDSSELTSLNRSIGTRVDMQLYDESIIDELNKGLAEKSNKNKVIFIHLMGSHASYCLRYPKEYEVFNGSLNIGEFGALSKRNFLDALLKNNLADSINCYDNSVLYNDYVIGSILKILQTRNEVSAFLYFSDHGEDVIGERGHESGSFTYQMTEIPMLLWLSDKYKDRYPQKYNALKKHVNKLYANDFIYDTLVGISNIETKRYNSAHDLSSFMYKFEEDSAYTLHGKKLYADKTNYTHHQKKNISELIADGQSARVIPHRVNSIGKLKDIWNDGYKSFEVDVRYGDNNAIYFEVGHNPGVMAGISLENFLVKVDFKDAKKIWVDLKNLTQNNYLEVLERLNYLDVKFNFREKIILESGATGAFFQRFSEDKWHTSYYLPTGTIIKLLEGDNTSNMKKLARQIARQSKTQRLHAVSFNRKLYPFVKKYLEPLLEANIVYHIWDLSIHLFNDEFHEKLIKTNYYMDNRVQTILVPYISNFNL